MASFNMVLDRETVINSLLAQFGDIIDSDIIRSVASNCDYKVERVAAILHDMSSNQNGISIPKTNMHAKKPWLKHSPDNFQPNSLPKMMQKVFQQQQQQQQQQQPPKPTKKLPTIARVINYIQQGKRIVILMRGLPGSGKSYLARHIIDKSLDAHDYDQYIFSTDDFFMCARTNQYRYNSGQIQEAHAWNQTRARKYMQGARTPLIIDNTNCQMWEMKPYVEMALQHGYRVEIVEPLTPWAFSCKELTQRNGHNVPRDTIRNMLERYERNITPEQIFAIYNLSFKGRGAQGKTAKDEACAVANTNRNNRANARADRATDVIHLSDSDDDDPIIVVSSQPVRNNAAQRTDDASLYANLNLSSWGLSENDVNAWQSWKSAAPLTELQNGLIANRPTTTQSARDAPAPPLITHAAATNTSSADFHLFVDPQGTKVLRGRNIDINRGGGVKTLQVPRKKMMLDKSSMTSIDEPAPKVEKIDDLVYLRALFPNIHIDYLRDVYEKCQNDINWSVDLLLDDEKVLPTISDNGRTGMEVEEAGEAVAELNACARTSDDDLVTDDEEELVTETIDNLCIDERNELKRHIEKNIAIKKEYYSDYVWKLKSARHNPGATSNDNVIATTPMMDVDTPTDDFELVNSVTEGAIEESVELNLGDALIRNLSNKFGFAEIAAIGFQPIIEVPISFARQLHAYYLESVFQQMDMDARVRDMIMKEDEELARELHRQEMEKYEQEQAKQGTTNSSSVAVEPPSLQEVMEEEVALNVYRKEVDQWKLLTPDDLASKLTRQKLCSLFPSVEQTLLVQILQAHNNSYRETVEVLAHSIEKASINDPQGTLMEPPITESTLCEMREAEAASQQLEQEQGQDEAKSASEYRGDAQKHYVKHQQLIQKAQDECRKGQFEVARFYSELARKQTQLYEQMNNLAACAFVDEHSSKLNFNMLDLHSLFVKEAIQALDIFLDRNINLLQGQSSRGVEKLFVITGRGKRSAQGRARIKPAVQNRLEKRKLGYSELNPGLLKVTVTRNSLISSNI